MGIIFTINFNRKVLKFEPAAFLSGGATMFLDALWTASMQQLIPDEVLSRVDSYDWMLSTIAAPVGLALVGVGFAIVGTIPGYMIPFGLIATPMLIRRLVRQPGKNKGMALTAGTLAAGLLYAAFVLSVSAF